MCLREIFHFSYETAKEKKYAGCRFYSLVNMKKVTVSDYAFYQKNRWDI